MPDSARVLVVGTTPDYVDWIRRACPGKVLFLTDAAVRATAKEPGPPPEEEVCCGLSDEDDALRALDRHLADFGISPEGVAAFDDESMELAAAAGRRFGLPYPGRESVANCRDKYRSKMLWKRHGLSTPDASRVGTPEAAARFCRAVGGPCVLKPFSGSGSELIFRCDTPAAAARHFRSITAGLKRRKNHPLYTGRDSGDGADLLAEAFVAGSEYSCDFLLENGRAVPLRLTRKILGDHDPLGTAVGYHLVQGPPEGFAAAGFARWLHDAAAALGLERAVCMVDFIVRGNRPYLLEMAPRPGGDCLPFLLRRAMNLDMPALTVAFARGRGLPASPGGDAADMLGLRIHARKAGVLKRIDPGRLNGDTRIREIRLTRGPGHVIRLPPADYDSWLMGHILFQPASGVPPAAQCREILDKIVMEVA